MNERLRAIAKTAALLAATGAAFFTWVFFEEFWRYRTLFDTEGRYFDPEAMIVHSAAQTERAHRFWADQDGLVRSLDNRISETWTGGRSF